MNTERYNIGKVAISVTSLPRTLFVIDNAFKENNLGYICVTNARTSYLANHDKQYCVIQNNSLLTVPDGTPLVWIAHNFGLKHVDKVSGKDLMDALFAVSAEKGYSHYFFGSTSSTIAQLTNNLRQRYPGIEIKGAVSPPFQPVEAYNIDELVAEINKVKPAFFWCGLGAPKQELLIAKLQPRLDNTICIGVGLAFEYLAGTVKRAPGWMQKYGLEWLYRLSQQPRNIKRAIKPLTWILLKVLVSFFQKK